MYIYKNLRGRNGIVYYNGRCKKAAYLVHRDFITKLVQTTHSRIGHIQKIVPFFFQSPSLIYFLPHQPPKSELSPPRCVVPGSGVAERSISSALALIAGTLLGSTLTLTFVVLLLLLLLITF